MKREGEKHYKAIVTLNFSPADNYDHWVPRDQVHAHFIRRTSSCIADANTKMRGPNGEILEIVIEDGHQVDVCLPKLDIEITNDKVPFSNIIAYRPSITCFMITHEILHDFGLWDEYSTKKYDCRVIQNHTMLSNHNLIWDHIFYRNFGDSLIEPVYFYSLLYGNCSLRSDIKLFGQCSRLSYQSSKDNPGCLEQKAICESQEILGRDKIREQQRIQALIDNITEEIAVTEEQIRATPPPVGGHPHYSKKLALRSNLFGIKRRLQGRRNFLRDRLRFVADWPDPK